VISKNEKWAQVARTSTDKISVSLIFQAAALKVRADRAAKVAAEAVSDTTKKANDIEARRKEKEAANRKPASKAAGTTSRSTATPGERLSTIDVIKNRRAEL